MSKNNIKSPKLITSYLENSKKRNNSALSPVEQEHQNKKPNKGIIKMDKESASLEGLNESPIEVGITESNNLKSLLIPLMEKVDKLRESIDSKYTKLEDTITAQNKEVSQELHKLEETITTQRVELKDSLTNQIQESNTKVQQVINENVVLRQENQNLKDRLDRLETAQLSNNVIITGTPEQQWDSYTLTKQRVYDMIAASKGTSNDPEAITEARKIEISYCTRIGRYRPNISL